MRDSFKDLYFEWLCGLIYDNKLSESYSCKKLLYHLHDIEFTYMLPRDRNRAEDGIELRYRFVVSEEYQDMCDDILYELSGPCSVLEMMIGLAIRCEDQFMDDPSIGDRTSQWFWGMVVNLGLGSIFDFRYDRRFVEDVIAKFLRREYEPDGSGGLFTIRHCGRDLRSVEIWKQMCWYLDKIT